MEEPTKEPASRSYCPELGCSFIEILGEAVVAVVRTDGHSVHVPLCSDALPDARLLGSDDSLMTIGTREEPPIEAAARLRVESPGGATSDLYPYWVPSGMTTGVRGATVKVTYVEHGSPVGTLLATEYYVDGLLTQVRSGGVPDPDVVIETTFALGLAFRTGLLTTIEAASFCHRIVARSSAALSVASGLLDERPFICALAHSTLMAIGRLSAALQVENERAKLLEVLLSIESQTDSQISPVGQVWD